MKHINIICAILSSIVICINPLMEKSLGQELPKYAPGSLIVKFSEQAAAQPDYRIRIEQAWVITGLPTVDSLCAFFKASSFKPFYREIYDPIKYEKLGRDRLFVLQFPPMADMEAIADIYSKDPKVEEAYPNYLFYVEVTPNDPYYSSQWALPKISAPSAWGITKGNSSIIIGIFDTGVGLDHPDLQSKLTSSDLRRDEVDIDTSAYKSAGYTLDPDEDYTTPDNVPQDRDGHGTHVAGIAAATTNNDTGVAGVAWYPKIMPLKGLFRIYHPALGWHSTSETEDICNLINWAINTGEVDVLNFSVGTYEYASEVEALIDDAYDAGITMVGAAGNGNTSDEFYPAAYDNVIAVGATDQSDHRCDPGDWGEGCGSNYGSWLDVAAPGNSIRSTYYNNTYIDTSGTSMAAPHVSGLAALLISKHPSLTPAQVKKQIEHTAAQVGGYSYNPTTGKSTELGHGRINAYNALKGLFVPSTEYPTIQSAIDNAASGQEVWVSSGNYYEDIEMKSNVDVMGLTKYVSKIYGDVVFPFVSGSMLADFTVYGTISIEDGSYACISDVYIYGSPTAVSVTQGSELYVVDVGISGTNNVGVYCYYAYVYVYGAEIEHEYKALNYPSYGYVELLDFDFCYNLWDIYKNIYTSIYVEDYNTFSDEPPAVCYGMHEWEYPTYYYVCSLPKAASSDDHQPGTVEAGAAPPSAAGDEAYNLGMGLLRELDEQRVAAIRADTTWNARDYAGQYAEAIALLKQAIADSLDVSRAWVAIGRFAASYWQLEQSEELYQYLGTLQEAAEYAGLRPIVDNQLISYYLRQANPAAALEIANDLLATSLDDGDRAALLYRMGSIYQRLVDDSAQAVSYYRQVVENYPEDPASDLARSELEEMGTEVPVPAAQEEEPEVTELSLSGYPNPFNPTATVRFGLPEAGSVTLIVYDLLGREVVRLVEGYREAGWHELVWDGRDASDREVPTGLYIARLVTPQGVRGIKLLMMK